MNDKRIISVLYVILFGVLVVMIGGISAKNLVNFYVNDEIDYNEWTADLGDKFETDIATTFFGKFQFVNLNGAFRNLLGQHEMNRVVKLNNGYLLTTIDYIDDNTLHNCVENISSLNKYLENRGTSLIYTITPYTSGKYDPQIPVGVEDYGNDDADRLKRMLLAANIDTIDFRETMHEDGMNHYNMMYRTDHHWNTEAGFYAYEKLENYIVSETGCKVDERISNIDNYTITSYPNWHLGSRGQRTGIYYAGIDDFDLIIPDFDTQIQNDAGTIGTMQDIIINMEPLEQKEYTSRYTYDYVLGGTAGHYINLDAENDIKILFIADSFGKAVAPYLVMGFSEVAYVSASAVSPEYIEEYDPDVVILMYYTPNVINEGTYNYNGFDEAIFG